MNPQTPGFGDYDTGSSMEDTLPAGIEVHLSDSYSDNYMPGKIGVITDASGSAPQVRLQNSGQMTYVGWSSLRPTTPAKNDKVKVLRGEYKNMEGTFKQSSGGEVIVATDRGELINVDINNLGKFVSTY